MGAYDETFEWVDLPEGRARFSGGIRGIDEQGHETFAVEVDGNEFFGEIRRTFLPNNNDYNIEVVSFGYNAKSSFGMPMPAACRAFTPAETSIIERLIVQLVAAGIHFPDRPTLMKEYPNAHFMGKVVFREGWVIPAGENVSPMSREKVA